MTTNRLVLAAALLLLLQATAASAQTFGYGAKIGVSFATVKVEDDEDLNSSAKAGLIAGGFVTLRLASRLAIEVDLFYSVRTSEFDGGFVDTLSYVDVPIVARIGIITRPSWRLHALGGGVIGSLQKAEETGGGITADITAAVESVEFAAIAGAELELRGRWLIDFRYVHGISDIYTAPNFSATSRTFQIMGGYRLR